MRFVDGPLKLDIMSVKGDHYDLRRRNPDTGQIEVWHYKINRKKREARLKWVKGEG